VAINSSNDVSAATIFLIFENAITLFGFRTTKLESNAFSVGIPCFLKNVLLDKMQFLDKQLRFFTKISGFIAEGRFNNPRQFHRNIFISSEVAVFAPFSSVF